MSLTILEGFRKHVKILQEKDCPMKWEDACDILTAELAWEAPIREMLIGIKPDSPNDNYYEAINWMLLVGVDRIQTCLQNHINRMPMTDLFLYMTTDPKYLGSLLQIIQLLKTLESQYKPE